MNAFTSGGITTTGGYMGGPSLYEDPYHNAINSYNTNRTQDAYMQQLLMHKVMQQQAQANLPSIKAPAGGIEQEAGVRDHLQRRVSKWLKGVDLPLH